MTLWVAAAVVATSMIGTTFMYRWASKYLIRTPNHRSSHTRPTPHGGGVGPLVAIAIGAGLIAAPEFSRMAWPLAAMMVMSLVDDAWTLPPRLRLIGQLGIATAAIFLVGGFTQVAVPPFGTLHGATPMIVLSGLWFVGMTNVYNFLDGIDGIATVQAIVAGFAWWIIGSELDSPAVSTAGALVVLACLGFLPFNWQVARIFMGDVGSATFGAIFALLPMLASQQGMSTAAPVGILVVWPFLFDGVFTVTRRARRKEPLFEAHRSHLYQRLVIAGWSHAEVTTLYALFAVVSAAAAVQVAAGAWAWGWGAAVLVGTAQWYITVRAEQRAGQRSPVSVS